MFLAVIIKIISITQLQGKKQELMYDNTYIYQKVKNWLKEEKEKEKEEEEEEEEMEKSFSIVTQLSF